MAIADENSLDPSRAGNTAGRALVLIYGVVSYALFFGIFLYVFGFLAGAGVPKAINDGTLVSTTNAAIVNLLLLGLFAIQHTIMARPAFKRWFTQFVPAVIERSTFVLLTSLILILMVWQWRPMPEVIWQIQGLGALVLNGIFALGFAIVLLSTFQIDHFDLFGLKQTVCYALRREPRRIEFQERFFYRYVRHPLMLGFMIAFWAAPNMTQGHLLFALTCTVYILIALIIEEKTLVELHGESYQDYQRRVPKLIPGLRPRG